ncbi:monomeric [FeFe] hydrogenase [Marispirochaeta aestuarii]|uniref:monomeric [FeFe] hydrogenase n=1 Tax=Marispirochaeta aestuarii TaxID=1963862 RepID=UPI002ABE2B85|nr:monomeric [FeFe] hydrogenase [Marispirochaeta aestuarii]
MNNNTVFLRIQLAKRFLQGIINRNLADIIDKIPVDLFPKKGGTYRCCIYKDRAITRYRLMALLGFSIEDETDETRPLKEYAEEAGSRQGAPEGPVLTLIDAACHSCPSGRHTVSNLCRGCLARNCASVCPRDAVSFVNGKAVIDHEKCVNCGKCREACPYNAVVYTPVPCEAACPVGAIRKNEDGSALIDHEKCISCGQCSISCPFGAVMERSHLYSIARDLLGPESERPVALVAPAAAGQFPGGFGQLTTALRQAGFAAVVEVAWGAAETVRKEAEELAEHLKKGKPLASSCCPAYTEAVRLHCPDFAPHVSTAPTPMAASAAWAKEEWPNRRTVFIGPCIAKRVEARRDKSADLVMTFEELASLFLAMDIDVAECSESGTDNPRVERFERLFARAGGVSQAVLTYAGETLEREPEVLRIDGLDKKALAKLRLIASGKLSADFTEVMSCPGGCICGPGTVADPRVSSRRLDEYAEEKNLALSAAGQKSAG